MTRRAHLALRTIPVAIATPVQLTLGLPNAHPVRFVATTPAAPEPTVLRVRRAA